MKLTEAIEALCIATRADGRSPRTIGSYQEKLGHLVKFLGDVDIEGVTIHDLRRYVADQHERELSPFTIKTRVRALKRLFNFLIEEGILTENPAERIKTPNPKRGKPKGISWDDFTALLKTTKENNVIDLRDRAVIMFLYDTGCRVGGLSGLKVDDLNLERRRAVVTEKGKKTRIVFYDDLTAQAIKDWLEVRPDDKGDWLFVSFKGQYKQFTVSGVYHMLVRRGERAGCEGPINPHAFRHGFARSYLLSGGDLGTLADLLGHGTVEVTKSYYGIFTADELQRKHDQHSPIKKLEGSQNEK